MTYDEERLKIYNELLEQIKKIDEKEKADNQKPLGLDSIYDPERKKAIWTYNKNLKVLI